MQATPKASAAAGLANLALVLLCLALLGWLTTRHLPASPVRVGGFIVGFLLLPALGLATLSGLLSALNPVAASTHGKLAGLTAVSSGMLLIIPFTILALIAEFALNWSAAQTFATAGVMTGAGAVGMEMSKLGPGRLANTVVPAVTGGAFVVGWILLSALLQAVSRRNSFIKIKSDSPTINITDVNQARLSAHQSYESSTWWDRGTKHLVLRKQQNAWLITVESFSMETGGKH